MKNTGKMSSSVPDQIVKDYYLLGLDPGASVEVCKRAQKALLKRYHPDRHSETQESYVKASDMSAKVNVAYQRIEYWLETGKIV